MFTRALIAKLVGFQLLVLICPICSIDCQLGIFPLLPNLIFFISLFGSLRYAANSGRDCPSVIRKAAQASAYSGLAQYSCASSSTMYTCIYVCYDRPSVCHTYVAY